MRISLLLFCLFLTINSLAQKGVRFRDIIWPEKDAGIELPKEFENEDVVILQRKHHWDLSRRLAEFDSDFEQYYYRYKFLSYEGIRKYGFGIVPLKEGSIISRIDIRISHPDGTSSDLRAKSLKRFINPIGTPDFPPDQFIIIRIPVLQPGDELEIFYEYDGPSLPARSFFFDILPIVNSQLIISHDDFENVLYGQYNGLPEPSLNEELHVVKLKWEQNNVMPFRAGFHVFPENHLPHVAHAYEPAFIENRDLKLGWKAYGYQTALVSESLAKFYDKQLENYLQESWGSIPFENKWERLNAVHQRINKEVVVHTRKSDRISIGYSLYNGSIHYDDLVLLYIDLFERLEMDYTVGLGRDIRTGALDTSFYSLTQVTHYGFRFPKSDKEMAFVFPKKPNTAYKFNQLPFELYSTEMLLIETEKPYKYQLIEIKPPASRYNRILFSTDVDLNKFGSGIHDELKMYGAWIDYYSSGIWKNRIWGNEESCFRVDLDTAYQLSSSHLLLEAECVQENLSGDSIYSLNIGDLIPLFPLNLKEGVAYIQDISLPHIQEIQIRFVSGDGHWRIEQPFSELKKSIPELASLYMSIKESDDPSDFILHIRLEIFDAQLNPKEASELIDLLTFAQQERILVFKRIP